MLPSPSTVRKRIRYGWDRETAETAHVHYTKRDRTNKHPSLSNLHVLKRIDRGRDEHKAMTTPKQTRGGPRYKF